jgi:hypothetical protein
VVTQLRAGAFHPSSHEAAGIQDGLIYCRNHLHIP